MSSFIENIYDEISLTMIREDKKIPLNSIGNKNVKIETMLSTLNKHINKSDIAYIDYSLGGVKNQSINPLNELFCDNIIVFSPTENIYLFKLNENKTSKILILSIFIKNCSVKQRLNLNSQSIKQVYQLKKIKLNQGELNISVVKFKLIE